MFKALKYFLLATLYKKAKKSFMMLFIYVTSLILISFILNDLINISSGISIYILLLVKWLSILLLLGLVVFSILKILNIATNPFEKHEKEVVDTDKTKAPVNNKKNRILEKDQLFTTSDLIMQKYMKD
jgi:hypothetical protein